MLGGGIADTASMWGAGILLGVAGRAVDIIRRDRPRDAELSGVRAAIAAPVVDEGVRSEAAMRRDEKLQAIGSEATFFSGLARIDGEFRSIRVAVTPHDFVLLDNWTHVDPETELGRIPRDSITDAVIVDETGNQVADQLLDPIRELETPEEKRYTVLLKRREASGALPPVSFLFSSGEPALACRTSTAAASGRAVDRLSAARGRPPARAARRHGRSRPGAARVPRWVVPHGTWRCPLRPASVRPFLDRPLAVGFHAIPTSTARRVRSSSHSIRSSAEPHQSRPSTKYTRSHPRIGWVLPGGAITVGRSRSKTTPNQSVRPLREALGIPVHFRLRVSQVLGKAARLAGVLSARHHDPQEPGRRHRQPGPERSDSREHADQHRPERPVLLAVDKELGEVRESYFRFRSFSTSPHRARASTSFLRTRR